MENNFTGYEHPYYALALSEFGVPHELPNCKGYILKRRISNFNEFDGMGCYPFFTCGNWVELYNDLNYLTNEIIALSAVINPFGSYNFDYLKKCFKNVVLQFKEHFVVDLINFEKNSISNNHKRNAKKALKLVKVETIKSPIKFLNDWIELYNNLINIHNITGIRAFSKNSFAKQMVVPGIVAFRACYNEKTVGMIIWYIQNNVAYYHLGAYSNIGYQLKSSFGLFWRAIQYFKETEVQWLSLGAGAGVKNNSNDGLTRFKRGWATGTRPSYFCGRIFDKKRYSEISKFMKAQNTEYFPSYRVGEYSLPQKSMKLKL